MAQQPGSVPDTGDWPYQTQQKGHLWAKVGVETARQGRANKNAALSEAYPNFGCLKPRPSLNIDQGISSQDDHLGLVVHPLVGLLPGQAGGSSQVVCQDQGLDSQDKVYFRPPAGVYILATGPTCGSNSPKPDKLASPPR